MNHLLSYISAEPATIPVLTDTKALATKSLGTLVKLEPFLTDAEQFEVIKITTECCLPSPTLSPNTKRKDITISQEDNIKLTNDLLEELQSLLIIILSRRYTSENLENIFKHLDNWCRSTEVTERIRSMEIVVQLLDNYEKNTRDNENARILPLQTHIIGRMVPRCSDPNVSVRQMAITCIQLTLKICASVPGEEDQLVNALTVLKERAESDEANSLFSLCNDLSKVLCKKLSSDFLWLTVQVLIEGLIDYQGHSSSGACVVLNNIVKQRGQSLVENIPDLVDCIHQQLPHITNTQTRTGTLRCIRTLGYQFLEPMVTHLLNKPFAWDSELIAIWEVISGDTQLVTNVIKHLLEVLTLTLPYQEKARTSATSPVVTYQRTETQIPKAVSYQLNIGKV
jgi:hypothetical protein